jgi:hypothetical protein
MAYIGIESLALMPYILLYFLLLVDITTFIGETSYGSEVLEPVPEL